MIKSLIEEMRPAQWTKNLVVFAGIIFAQKMFDFELLLKAVIAFVIFCMLSGSGYLINDIVDREQDRHHPRKSKRPLVSGRLRVCHAVGVAVALILISVAVAFSLDTLFGISALAYLLLNLAYSLYLKHIVIVDVITLAIGFVLRAVAGAVVISVPISSWLLICTVLLALFLGLSKRRHELILLEEKAGYHRKILTEYSPALLNEMISVVTSSTVIAYSLYTFYSETALKTHYLMLTIPFVLYGIFRYLYLIYQKNEGGSPEVLLLTDKPLLVDIALWLVAVMMILYAT